MKRVSRAKTPCSLYGSISPRRLVTIKVLPWLIVIAGGPTVMATGIDAPPVEKGSGDREQGIDFARYLFLYPVPCTLSPDCLASRTPVAHGMPLRPLRAARLWYHELG